MSLREIGKRVGFLGVVVSTVLLLGAVASASAAPKWKIDSLSKSSVEPGETILYGIDGRNVGRTATDGTTITFSASLPEGMTVETVRATHAGNGAFYDSCTAANGEPVAGQRTVVCKSTGGPATESLSLDAMSLLVSVSLAASGTLMPEFEISGGGAGPSKTVDPTEIGPPREFGIESFDAQIPRDESGAPSTAAASHPYEITTRIELNSTDPAHPGPLVKDPQPVEPVKDIFVEQMPGFWGNPTKLAQCTMGQMANGSGPIAPAPLCPPESQVGTTYVHFHNDFGLNFTGPFPLYNLVPPPGIPARFAFNIFGTVVVLDAEVRNGGDYGLTVGSTDIGEGLPTVGSTVTFWGVPASEGHDFERSCPGNNGAFNGQYCKSEAEPTPFLRQPTQCTPSANTGLPTTLRTDSWFHPDEFAESTFLSHEAPGAPYPREQWGEGVGITDCESAPFEPSVSIQPTTHEADAPSGLDVELGIPQDCWEEIEAICQSDLKDTSVTLPEGMVLNPSSAHGLGSCSEAQFGLHTETPPSCPDDSKIGTVSIDTPLLGENPEGGEKDLSGSVYLAKQGENPFGSLLAIYFAAEGAGVVLKQAGQIEVGPGGQLTTSFKGSPQAPFTSLHLSLKGGVHAPLRTPASCGEYASTAVFAPWSGNPPVSRQSGFSLNVGPAGSACPTNGFAPRLRAGTANPGAGAFTPFVLDLSRTDGTREISGLQATLPKGLLAKLAGVSYCPQSALDSVSGEPGTGAAIIAHSPCPAQSQIGTVFAAAGAGADPFSVNTGRAYLAGPYKGAPLSIAVLVPAVAGPIDLGSVLVRNALEIDRETTQARVVSDPIPTELQGIPLDVRQVHVQIDRHAFTLNPTDCDPSAVEATVAGTGGASATLSNRFQVGNCNRLAFKPKLSLRLRGKTRRGGTPALSATLTMPPGGANIARAQVTLPHSEFLDNAHIGTVCTRVQFAANQCPAKSVYGFARAVTPLLEKPLEGPVYLRSSSHQLPDLVADLNGQLRVALDGRIDSVNGGIRNTFEVVPDAPVTKFTLTMAGGKKGLLQNSTNLCNSTNRAIVRFDGQNGKIADSRPPLKDGCAKKRKRAGHHHG